MAQQNKTARVVKRSTEMIHSDSELAQKMEPAVQAPEASPSNTELVENSHAENGGSPVLDGDLHSPERANVNAMREALETQTEMEVGKPIAEKQKEVKSEETGQSMEIDAKPGKQIIINIASDGPITSGMSDINGVVAPNFESWDYPGKKAAFLKSAGRFLTIDEVKKAGQEYVQRIRTAAINISQGQDAKGFHMLIDMGGREYALYGEDADDFRSEYAAISKPEAKVNALVEKYMWKLQPYEQKPRPAKITQTPESKTTAPAPQTEQKPDIKSWLDIKEQKPDIKSWLDIKDQEDKGKPTAQPTVSVPAFITKRVEAQLIGLGYTQEQINKMKPEEAQRIVQSGKGEYSRYGVPQNNYASDKTADGEMPATEPKDHKYEGWTNWETWHVALLIDNTESIYNSKRRLALNALKKGIGIDQLAAQFSRMFKKQEQETKDFYEENAASARGDRGRYEREQLEGGPMPSGDKAQDMAKRFGDLFYDIGGQSDWERPMGEVNWREIAWHAAEQEEQDQKAKGVELKKPKNPQPFTKEDTDYLKKMRITTSLKEAAMPEKGTPEWHQVRIALDTLRMNSAMVGVMGGMTKADAMKVLDKYGIKYKTSKNGFFSPEDAKKFRDNNHGSNVALNQDEEGYDRWEPVFPNKEKTMDNKLKEAGNGMAKSENDIEKEAGFNLFFPGQVLKEFYPEIQHEIVDYPNANNSPMGAHAPEMVGDGGHDMDAMIDGALDNMSIIEAIQLPGDVGELEELHTADASTSPAGGMGIGRDGKTQVLEGVPLRKENDIRGPMFTEEFYGQYQGINGKSLAMAALKTAAGTEVEQFEMFLKKVVGEIAATMLAAFKVTSRPLLDKVPGVGEVQLAQIEQPLNNPFATVNTASRVKYLMDKLNDSDIQDAINDAWAQAAVWHDGPKGGYVYEVFVRAESIDTDSMLMKYKFVAGTRE